MSIIDKLTDESTNMRRPSMWQTGVRCKQEVAETDRIDPRGFATQEEYVLRLVVEATYWANRAQRDDAREVAKRALVRTLYADILSQLHRLQLAISNGDRDEAMQLCCEFTKIVEGT